MAKPIKLGDLLISAPDGERIQGNKPNKGPFRGNLADIPAPPGYLPNAEKVYKIAKKGNKLYIGGFIAIFLSVSAILYFAFNRQIVLTMIASFIAIPIILLSLIIMIAKFFIYDFRKVKKIIIKKLSHNFIILDIFKSGKRIDQKVCLINDDGKTATDGKKDYTIDNKGVWFDWEGYPHVFVLDNLPNNVLFDFGEDLDEYVKSLNEQESIPEKEGVLIDVSYSSSNLQLLKKDKIFSELHKDPEANKIIMLLIGALIIISIIFMVIFLVSRGGN